MLKSLLRIGATSALAAAIAFLPAQLLAQSTNKPPVQKKTTAEKKSGSDQNTAVKKKSAHPFHGNLAAVDQTAKTITVGKSTYQITSETKITKAGKPATLADGVVGEEVGGYAKPTDDGKMAATTLRFGAKPEAAPSSEKPKDTTAKPKPQ